MKFSTSRATRTSAGNNLETRGSAISITTNTRVTHNFEAVPYNQTDNKLEMGITPDNNATNTVISLESEPPVPESDSTIINWASLNSYESKLLEEEVDMSFEEDSLKDFLLDHDIESVTVSNSSRFPASHTISYKEMPNFGNSETGLTRPLLSVVGSAMECEEMNLSRVDSPFPTAPVSAPCSPQAVPARTEVLPTISNTPVANPVELHLAAGEAQGILYGVPSSTQDEDDDTPNLVLPQALVTHQSWVSRGTNLKISETCGEAGNRICRQCGRKFSSAQRLHVHAPNIS